MFCNKVFTFALRKGKMKLKMKFFKKTIAKTDKILYNYRNLF